MSKSSGRRCSVLFQSHNLSKGTNYTSLTSSKAKYALKGRSGPELVGSTTVKTGAGQYFWKRSLIFRSEDRSLPPVWYQPTGRSLALTFLNRSDMFSWKLWSMNQTDGSVSLSSNGTKIHFINYQIIIESYFHSNWKHLQHDRSIGQEGHRWPVSLVPRTFVCNDPRLRGGPVGGQPPAQV